MYNITKEAGIPAMLVLTAAKAPNDVRLLPKDGRVIVRADLILQFERAVMTPKHTDKSKHNGLQAVKPNDLVVTQEVTLLSLSTGSQLAVIESLDEILVMREVASETGEDQISSRYTKDSGNQELFHEQLKGVAE